MAGGDVAVIVDIVHPAWRDLGRGLDASVSAAARAAIACSAQPVSNGAELGVRLTDDADIRDLNRAWRDRDAATNVLAFALNDAPGSGAYAMLGDVVIALETCRDEARDQDKTIMDHLTHLVVHGTLHLLGFDHQDEAEADAMESLERTVLEGLGIADPYVDHRSA